jgi:hypothetical protein
MILMKSGSKPCKTQQNIENTRKYLKIPAKYLKYLKYLILQFQASHPSSAEALVAVMAELSWLG